MVSCQKGPTRHAYAWQIGLFWQASIYAWHSIAVSGVYIRTMNKILHVCVDYYHAYGGIAMSFLYKERIRVPDISHDDINNFYVSYDLIWCLMWCHFLPCTILHPDINQFAGVLFRPICGRIVFNIHLGPALSAKIHVIQQGFPTMASDGRVAVLPAEQMSASKTSVK